MNCITHPFELNELILKPEAILKLKNLISRSFQPVLGSRDLRIRRVARASLPGRNPAPTYICFCFYFFHPSFCKFLPFWIKLGICL